MSKIREEIESFKFINTNNPRKIEKLSEGSTGTLYRLKQTTQPLAIKCIKNVKMVKELISQKQEALELIRCDSD